MTVVGGLDLGISGAGTTAGANALIWTDTGTPDRQRKLNQN